VIYPAPGFTIILAANTKGHGDESGLFAGANIQNDANLDRFPITYEHPFPDPSTEALILTNRLQKMGHDRTHDFFIHFVDCLVNWANKIRTGQANESHSHTISTRRLLHVLDTYDIFKDKDRAVASCVARFPPDIQSAWLNLYHSVDRYHDEPTTDAWTKRVEQEKRQEKIKPSTTTAADVDDDLKPW
jgi:hypothetical protein